MFTVNILRSGTVSSTRYHAIYDGRTTWFGLEYNRISYFLGLYVLRQFHVEVSSKTFVLFISTTQYLQTPRFSSIIVL